MSYIPLKDEEHQNLAQSMVSTQLMMGVYPSEKYINKVKEKYKTPEEIALPNKVLEQDKNIIAASNLNFEKCQELNSQMDDAIIKVGNKLDLIELSLNNKENENPYSKELDSKVGEYKRETEANEEKVKNIKESMQELQRKKKKSCS